MLVISMDPDEEITLTLFILFITPTHMGNLIKLAFAQKGEPGWEITKMYLQYRSR
jgi:hypothetical protein